MALYKTIRRSLIVSASLFLLIILTSNVLHIAKLKWNIWWNENNGWKFLCNKPSIRHSFDILLALFDWFSKITELNL